MSLYVILVLILYMIDLAYFFLKFLNKSKSMTLRVFLIGAKSIRYIVLVVSNKPHSILSFQLIPLVGLGPQSFDLHR